MVNIWQGTPRRRRRRRRQRCHRRHRDEPSPGW